MPSCGTQLPNLVLPFCVEEASKLRPSPGFGLGLDGYIQSGFHSTASQGGKEVTVLYSRAGAGLRVLLPPVSVPVNTLGLR